MTDKEHNNNQEKPSYRKPKVQNFRSLKDDLQKVSQDPNRSLAKIVLASKARKWEELESGDVLKKVRIDSPYTKTRYKIILLSVVFIIIVLALYRTNMTPSENSPQIQQASTTAATSSVATTSQESSTSTFTNE